jgi:3'-phosphoadenosine 5'-phosphosulfate sulfotransferase (PAPS reductase)/FAD synthetase
MTDYLDELESEAIYILREVAGQFEKPALLFSGGKDSITLVHLALKPSARENFHFRWFILIRDTISQKPSNTVTGSFGKSARN